MRSLFDTSVLVPTVVDQLANHEAAFEALRRHGRGVDRGLCADLRLPWSQSDRKRHAVLVR